MLFFKKIKLHKFLCIPCAKRALQFSTPNFRCNGKLFRVVLRDVRFVLVEVKNKQIALIDCFLALIAAKNVSRSTTIISLISWFRGKWTPKRRQASHLPGPHFPLNHDYGRKGITCRVDISPFRWQRAMIYYVIITRWFRTIMLAGMSLGPHETIVTSGMIREWSL